MYDPKIKRQSLEWVCKGSPWLEKLWFQKLKVKTRLVLFFIAKALSTRNLYLGHIVNKEYYVGVMDRLLKPIQRVRPEFYVEMNCSCCRIMRVSILQSWWCNSFSPENASPSFITHHTPQICLPRLFCIPKTEVGPQRSPIWGYWVSSTECNRSIEGDSTSRLQMGDEWLGSTHATVYRCRGCILNNFYFLEFFLLFS